jgi:hypothetical protein
LSLLPGSVASLTDACVQNSIALLASLYASQSRVYVTCTDITNSD